MRIVDLTKETAENILENMLKRSPTQYGTYEAAVNEIVTAVREKKDAAVFSYTEKFDGAKLDASSVEVTEEEVEEAYRQVDEGLIDVIRKARANILAYHEKQKENSWFTSAEEGTLLGQKVTPLNRVGVYVPGGKAAYPSSVLMNVLPAQVAGVREICMVTPCNREGKVNPVVLAAAKEAGVQRIFKIGGAQAVAALALWSAAIAGPSEILVLADETANPRFVAADLLSQAEHDELASAILITTSRRLAEQVDAEIRKFLETLSRREIIEKSLDNFGYLLVAESKAEAIETVNQIAPEHLEIVTANPFEDMMKVRNAGAIFLGENSCEPLGDYFAGPNHILPTNGTAKFFSPLSVDDFVKKSSVI